MYEYLTCDYFNYEDLPDLSFVLKGGIKIMALSIDLFKLLNKNSLELKIKHLITENKYYGDNNWYLGEPVIKNYNFLLNYTDEKNVELIITPSSLNGFILIIVACVGGFLFLFLFLTIIYCASKKDKQNHKRKSYFSFTDFKSKKNSDIFFGAKNSYIKEKIEENQDEDQKSKGSENSDSNSEDNNSNNSDDKLFNIEEKKLDEDEEALIGNALYNESFSEQQENKIDDNLIINTNIANNNNLINNINNENNNNIINNRISNNQDNPINIELSINSCDDEEEKELMIKSHNGNKK